MYTGCRFLRKRVREIKIICQEWRLPGGMHCFCNFRKCEHLSEKEKKKEYSGILQFLPFTRLYKHVHEHVCACMRACAHTYTHTHTRTLCCSVFPENKNCEEEWTLRQVNNKYCKTALFFANSHINTSFSYRWVLVKETDGKGWNLGLIYQREKKYRAHQNR